MTRHATPHPRLPAAAVLMLAILGFAGTNAGAQDKFTVTVTNDLATARPAETIVIPFKEVRARIPGVLLDCVAVRDAKGSIIPAQVTNFTPEARPVLGDDLVWQHDFAPGEKTAVFTIERTAKPVPPFEPKTFARYVPERLDDFAFENDVIAHRMYGPALDTAAAGKSRMISSGIDVWIKSVRYPVINRWYLKGHDAYHVNSGEGIDMYDVGTDRGDGGTGIWDGALIHTSHNYATWRVLANGPIRTVFELEYKAWDAAGVKVTETKRFTIDAGRNLHQVDSTFTFADRDALTVAVGLSKPQRNATHTFASDAKTGWIANWITYNRPPKKNTAPGASLGEGSIGTAALLPAGATAGLAEDKGNNYILVQAAPGKPVRYYIGACWSKDDTGRFPAPAAWEAYLADFALRLGHPLAVTFSPAE
ncbi:DUF4861 domain-containing protein [Termitidicoccus mucosus]|uniref:DUF4861 domain-containing protein n=1 Tax=Termitidicoccus mucosus TaxID=1184151 RepID=A0A178IL27_9BACT|nr:hypothetical protein AW736_10905 [Opitutaceae bacterium TSB47]